ncbi:MAG TPA: hypothetical protein ENH91_03130 [Leeuwenhoekiella sp.]|nr:hypothetical protein [Leeuwenhoekiella sp.]
MCTVSVVHGKKRTFITSSRDEDPKRETALPPMEYVVNGKKLIFPKDPQGGGTWFCTDGASHLGVLLNGAAKAHVKKVSYRKSRGLILLDIMSAASSITPWSDINLNNIEPFTVILIQDQEYFRLRWDGENKETKVLDRNKNYIWSSTTLYSKYIRQEREQWFFDFLSERETLNAKDLLGFHKDTQSNDKENGLVINRNNQVKTLSITQSVVKNGHISLVYNALNPKSQINCS